MSNEIEEYDDFAPRRSRRTKILLAVVLGVIAAFFLVTTFASLYTDHLWYSSVGYTGVFDTVFWTRFGLFAGFGLLMAASVAGNMVIAYRSRPFFRPDSAEQSGLDRYRDAVTPIRRLLLISVSLVIGLFGGVAANGQWRSFLLWRNRVPFHTSDFYFHKDVGFYVFTLPWLHFVVGYVIAVLVLSALAAVVVHYLYGGIRLQAVQERVSGSATVQLTILVGLALVAKAAGYWLDRYDLVTSDGKVVTGMGYTDAHAVLPARNILVWVALICAVLFFVNVWRRSWLLPGVGISLLLTTSILLGLIWPAFVQHFQVNPTEADKEAYYIGQNIKATRTAYNLNGIEQTPYTPGQPATASTVQSLMDQTSSVPVVDPQLVNQSFEQSQQGQSYYTVAPLLDVDHYDINGIDRSLVLGARELNQAGIADQNWSNLHTVYTHGNGIIAAFGNQRPADDSVQTPQVQWAQGQDPGQNALEKATGPFEGRIYFGEHSPDYSIVGKTSGSPDVELNLNNNGTTGRTTYDGTGGVSVGSFFHKLMYSIKFGDANFLLSARVNSDSKVLYYRDPSQRVEKVAPWLTLDGDVYPAVVNGRILWIVDGYTTTNRYPQSQRGSFSEMTTDVLSRPPGVQTLPTDQINYIRNAVKATVDAYTGKVTLYAWDESDPILHAWRSAFPGTVLDKNQIPSDLMPHLRYPEDYFKVQRYQFARYHVTDPSDFYQANNRWDVPDDPIIKGQKQAPIRMFTRNPDTGQEMWSLTSNYVPRNKSNLVGFVSVDSDATSTDYGKIRVLESPDENTPGPGQVVSNLISSQHITRKIQTFKLADAQTSYGNLLTVPLEAGLMYVEPVYATRLQSDSATSLSLRYVMVSYGSQIGIGNTLVDAISDMVGATPPGQHQQQPPSKGSNAKAAALLEKAQRDFAAAEKALKQGNGADWVRLNHRAQAEVAKALNLLK